jgi:2-keto-4-pentenoate hydratase/2-oxohepta-3-ene-1,7-dioic acid hydratase in catechol pathway
MKLLRYGPNGHEMPGILDDNAHIHDLSGEVRDISEQMLLPLSLDRLKRLDVNSLPLVAGEPRIGRVGKFICIGLNYSDHGAEARVEGSRGSASTEVRR